MKVVDLRQFKAKRAKAAKKRPGKKLPPDHLAPVRSITPKEIKSSDGDDFDTMVENMSEDSDALHRGSVWLLRYAERLYKDSGEAIKKD